MKLPTKAHTVTPVGAEIVRDGACMDNKELLLSDKRLVDALPIVIVGAALFHELENCPSNACARPTTLLLVPGSPKLTTVPAITIGMSN